MLICCALMKLLYMWNDEIVIYMKRWKWVYEMMKLLCMWNDETGVYVKWWSWCLAELMKLLSMWTDHVTDESDSTFVSVFMFLTTEAKTVFDIFINRITLNKIKIRSINRLLDRNQFKKKRLHSLNKRWWNRLFKKIYIKTLPYITISVQIVNIALIN